MTTLHTINKSLTSPVAEKMLAALSPGDTVLLIEDACNSLAHSTLMDNVIKGTSKNNIQWLALDTDYIARGLQLPTTLRGVSHADFVRLVTETDKTVSWY